MSELHKSLVCLCGKQKSNLNDTNWKRHISACKISSWKVKSFKNYIKKYINIKILLYFFKKRDNSFVDEALTSGKSKYNMNSTLIV